MRILFLLLTVAIVLSAPTIATQTLSTQTLSTPQTTSSSQIPVVNSIIGSQNTLAGQLINLNGNQNTVVGLGMNIVGNQNAVIGAGVNITGNNNALQGTQTNIVGNNNTLQGSGNSLQGSSNIVSGNLNNINGSQNLITGSTTSNPGATNTTDTTDDDGDQNTIKGQFNEVDGSENIVVGDSNDVVGNENLLINNARITSQGVSIDQNTTIDMDDLTNQFWSADSEEDPSTTSFDFFTSDEWKNAPKTTAKSLYDKSPPRFTFTKCAPKPKCVNKQDIQKRKIKKLDLIKQLNKPNSPVIGSSGKNLLKVWTPKLGILGTQQSQTKATQSCRRH